MGKNNAVLLTLSLPFSHRGLQDRVRTKARPQHHHLQRHEQNDSPSAAALEAIHGHPGAHKDTARIHCKGRFAPRLSGAGVGGVDLRRGARFLDRFLPGALSELCREKE
ncbi:hypothetical protein JHK86_022350 [Glycine max]|nr:hypothetical protein JHK86_022350 [Glycine max]